MNRAIRAFRLALACLTIWPVKFRDEEVGDTDIAVSRLAYPLVGLVIGLSLALISEVLARGQASSPIAAFLLVTFGVAITGGLHLDGLADTADGLFLGGGPERRLAVLRDPHVGSFGVIALVLALLGRFAALASLAGKDRSLSLIIISVLGRCAILVAAGGAEYARPEGTGRLIVRATTRADVIFASAFALGLAVALRGGRGLGAACLGLAFVLGLKAQAMSRLRGVTGDILGAAVEVGEVGVLTGLAIFVKAG